MDISDGLAGDLAKILDLTGMTAEVMAADVPLSKAARKLVRHAPSLFETIFTGGDDYELLCAVPPAQSAAFEARANAAGLPVHSIGTAKPGHMPPTFKDPDGQNLVFAQPSFRHF
jgi:thiamine-monophosphate kinase